MSYDTWKATNREDNELGRSNGTPTRYRCLVCNWRGRGAMANRDHWYLTQHRPIVTDADPRYATQAAESEVA